MDAIIVMLRTGRYIEAAEYARKCLLAADPFTISSTYCSRLATLIVNRKDYKIGATEIETTLERVLF
jgi:hypothetical protein